MTIQFSTFETDMTIEELEVPVEKLVSNTTGSFNDSAKEYDEYGFWAPRTGAYCITCRTL